MAAPSARIIAVANAFVAELNAKLTEWGIDTTASRSYSVQYDLEQLADLHIDVQTVSLDETLVDRNPVVSDIMGLNVTVQQKVDPTDIDALDLLMNLTIGIFKNWHHEDTISGQPTVSVVEKSVVIYSPELLDSGTRYAGFVSFGLEEKT